MPVMPAAIVEPEAVPAPSGCARDKRQQHRHGGILGVAAVGGHAAIAPAFEPAERVGGNRLGAERMAQDPDQQLGIAGQVQ